MNTSVETILKEKCAKYGIPFSIIYAVVMTESGGDPLAVGDNGKSHGLFQIYTVAHPTYSVAKGKASISYQCDFWMPTLSATYKIGKAKGLTGVDLAIYVERYGERPVWTDNVRNSIIKYYNEVTGSTSTETKDIGVLDFASDPIGSIQTVLTDSLHKLINPIFGLFINIGVYGSLVIIVIISLGFIYKVDVGKTVKTVKGVVK